MSFLLRKDGYLVRKNGYLVRATTGDCSCCEEGGTCVSCAYCDGCATEDRPGCPTAACCTPDTIQVVVTGVDAAICTCFQMFDSVFFTLETDSRAKLFDAPTVDGTYSLVQTGGCTWEYQKSCIAYVDIYASAACTGSVVGGGATATTLTYTLIRSSATQWAFQIADDAGYTYFGSNPGNAGDGAVATATATENNCVSVATQGNEIATCSMNNNSLWACVSTGGSATFEVCL